MSRPRIAPSILSADFAILNEELATVERGGADWIHVDVMDGHFVPNLTIGPVVVSWLRPRTVLPLDCHLMVSEPEKWVEPFAKAGATCITVHVEAARDLPALLARIRALGCQAGVSINPSSSVAMVESVLDQLDLVLVMSVNPGFGGQKFMESAVSKIEELARLRRERELSYVIEVDGGIGPTTAPRVIAAGADILVAGSAIFGAADRAAAIESLRKA